MPFIFSKHLGKKIKHIISKLLCAMKHFIVGRATDLMKVTQNDGINVGNDPRLWANWFAVFWWPCCSDRTYAP